MRTLLRAVAVVTVLLTGVAPSLAEDPTPSPTPAASVTPTAPTVTPAQLDLGKKILISVGLKASMDQIVPAMLAQLQRQLLQMHPEMGKTLHETLTGLLPEFQQGEDAVFTDTSRTLAGQLSEAELQQTLTYFDSPAGKKYTQAQAPVLEMLASSGGLWREKLTTIMVDRTRTEMSKKGFKF